MTEEGGTEPTDHFPIVGIDASRDLQSIIEQLEASNQELQSKNKELITVNSQLASKLEELEARHNDLQNLTSATDIPTIWLDRELRVLWFTPATTELVRLSQADHGRLLADYAHIFRHSDLIPEAETVLQKLVPLQQEVECKDDRTFLRRITPYRTDDDRIAGVVITFVDITERRKNLEQIEHSLQEKEMLMQEIHHRVKNNLQVVSSLLSIHADSTSEPNVRAAFNDMRERVRSIALIHERLYQSDNLAKVDFAGYARNLLETLWHANAASNVKLKLQLDPLTLSIGPAVPFGLILNELASNSLQHAFRDQGGGEVTVSLKHYSSSKNVCLTVRDDGIGLPPEVDLQRPTTLGFRLVQMLARQLHGILESGEGPGSEIRMRFPVTEEHG